jgi:caffeoyl-CoA O-methyltransferase
MRDTDQDYFDTFAKNIFSRDLQFNALLDQSRAESDKIGKTQISLSELEGRMLGFFIQKFQLKKVIEFGTLCGYSALWIARTLPQDGELITVEKNKDCYEISKKILLEYSSIYQKKISLVLGDALQLGGHLESLGPFDGLFLDANKKAYPDYLNWAQKNLKVGGWLFADNIFIGQKNTSPVADRMLPIIEAMKIFNTRLADPKSGFSTCFLPTSEGMAIAQKV